MSDRSRSHNIQLVQLADQQNNRISSLDEVTLQPVFIETVHHEIHEGEHFTVAVMDTDVDIAGPKYVRITTPNTTKRIHFTASISADAAATAAFYEDPTLLAAGSGLTEYNNDRNSSTAATATTFEDTTTQAPNNDGTLLFSFRVGGTGVGQATVSGEGAVRQEWILKQNEDYLIKVTVDGDNTQVFINMTWYEEG